MGVQTVPVTCYPARIETRLRTATCTLLAVLLLAGCWRSENALLTRSEFVELSFADRYRVFTPYGPGNFVKLNVREQVLLSFAEIDIGGSPVARDEAEFGLVAIPGGDGHHFLAVSGDDLEDGATAGQLYFIAEFAPNGRITFRMPKCDGMTPRADMIVERSEGATICRFTNRASLLEAALEAERLIVTMDAAEWESMTLLPVGVVDPESGASPRPQPQPPHQ